MKAIKGVGHFLLGGGLLGVAARALLGGGGKKQVAAQPLPMPTRDDAAASLERGDAFRRRRGSAADQIVNGASGAEAAFAPGRLVLGN